MQDGVSGLARPAAAADGRRQLVAFTVFALLALLCAFYAWEFGRVVGVAAAIGAIPALLVARSRPSVAALVMVAAGIVLRVALMDTGPLTDQIPTTQAALAVARQGGNPYGTLITSTVATSPFPYGPLSLIAYIPGVWTEVVAASVTMLVLARRDCSVGLAFYAACPLLVRATVMGTNDILAGLLVTLAVLAGPKRVRWSAVALAAAVAVKPYAAAWLPGLLGAGGLGFALPFMALSAVFWSPLLVWGPASYLESLRLAALQHPPVPGSPPDISWLHWAAVPLAIVGLLRRHPVPVQALLGCAIFALVMLTASWVSLAYLLAPLPLLLIVGEAWAVERFSGARARQPAAVPA